MLKGGGSLSGDAFVTKLNTNGTALIYSTFLGGSEDDRGFDIAIDTIGNVFVAGHTLGDFPITPWAFQPIFGGYNNAFLVMLYPGGAGSADLKYSTYLGGSGGSCGINIFVDPYGSVYIEGAAGENFPTTSGAFQTAFGGGDVDAYVAKFNNAAFYTPTVTETPTITFTSTRTRTPSPSPTPTATATLTPTQSPTPTDTSTPCLVNGTPCTSTATSTATSTLTYTATLSPTDTDTPTITLTPTTTPLPPCVLYPNPVKNQEPVKLQLFFEGPNNSVNLKLFTVAFRKINAWEYNDLPQGVYEFPIELKDEGGKPLANGLYYVVAEVNGERKIFKLIVLR
jgi:hypothetical protein